MVPFLFPRIIRCSLRAAGLALMAAAGPLLFSQTSVPTALDGFDPNVTGTVNVVVVQPDGHILVGGNFTYLRPNGSVNPINRNNLARLNPDGTVDGSFAPQPNGPVDSIAIQPNGQVLIGGSFTTVQPAGATSSTLRHGLARFNTDGTLDTGFDPSPQGTYSSQVNAIALQGNGQILVGGAFSSFKPNGATTAIAIPYVARLNTDGSVDTTFKPTPNIQVAAICVQPNGQILIGGGFTTLQPNGATAAIPMLYLARLNPDGTNDASLQSLNLNGQVLSIALQYDGQIIIGGQFYLIQPSSAGGSTIVDFILRMSATGVADPTFTTNLSGPVQQVLVQPDGKILAAGLINTVTTVVGGTANFFNANNLVRLNHDGTPDLTFSPNPNYQVNGIALESDGRIILGGTFNEMQPNGEPAQAPRNGLARIYADGTLDQTFDPNAVGGIGVVTIQTDGNYLIGGSFSSVNGVTRNNLARISPAGVLDLAFAPQINGPVYAVAVQSNGQILVGGNFTSVNNIPIQSFARLNLDGTLDTTFIPNPNQGAVYAIVVQPNGKILIGGTFFGFGPAIGPPSAGATSIGFLGRINPNGSIDTTWQPNPTGAVYSIVFNAANNTVLIGGAFTAMAPVDFSNFQQGQYQEFTNANPYIALIDADNGLNYADFNPNPNGPVYQVAVQADGKYVFCGAFTTVQPDPTSSTTVVNGVLVTTITPITYQSYICRVNPDGTLDATFAPYPNAPVLKEAIDPANGNIVIGGTFTTVNKLPHPYLARLAPSGTVDSTFSDQPNGPVDALVYLAGSQFLAGGSFTTVIPPGATVATPAIHLARFNSDGSIDASLQSPFQAAIPVNALAVQPDAKIDIGGNFINLEGVFAGNIARVFPDGSQDPLFYANANAPVNSIAVETDGTFFVGGSFTAIGTGTAHYFAHLKVDSTLDTSYSNFPDGPVNAIAVQTNVPAVIGGAFAHVGSLAVANLARIKTDHSVDATFTPNPNGAVSVVVAQANGQYLVAGAFTSIAGGARNHFARLNADGSLDAAFNPNPNAGVSVVMLQPDGKILVGGAFTSIGGASRNYLARLNADGSLDAAFNPGANGAVNTMVLQAPGVGAPTSSNGSSLDQILVGGAFTSIGGASRNYVARLNYDGSIDASFNPNADGTVTQLAIQADGKPILTGNFSHVGGQPRSGFARLANPSGTYQSITVSPDLTTATFTMEGGPELSNAIFEISSDALNWSAIGYGTRVGLANSWQLSNLGSLPSGGVFYIQVLGQSFTSNGSTASVFQGLQGFNILAVGDIKSASMADATVGAPFYYEIAATNAPTSYTASALPAGLNFNAVTGVVSGTPLTAGNYTITLGAVTAGGTTTTVLALDVLPAGSAAPVAPLSRLLNLSARSLVSTANPLIAGFVISGPGPKAVLLRAVGPGLATTFQMANVLSHPVLELYDSNAQLILSNKGWDGSGTIMQIFAEVGAFSLSVGSADSAAVTTLAPGNYTMEVVDGAGTGGTALAEVYDADNNPLSLPQRLVNLSGRGTVNGSNLLIGGFSITGTVSKTVLVRAVGPGLATTFGLANALATPTLALYDNHDTLLAQNTGWGNPTTVNAGYPAASAGTISAADSAVGAFALASGSADSAVVVTLPPGNYTGQITGGGQGGTALFEIYDLQ